jgi:peptidoglycan/LPS O-acetylase OafA/YrhL
MGSFFIFLLFVLSFEIAWVSKALSSRALLMLGFASYPLYLLHQNIMVQAAVALHRVAPWVPGMIWPLAVAGVLVALSWVIATTAEPALRYALTFPRRVGFPTDAAAQRSR